MKFKVGKLYKEKTILLFPRNQRRIFRITGQYYSERRGYWVYSFKILKVSKIEEALYK
jgi:hypothetical protein